MSSFYKAAYHPPTKSIRRAFYMDDYFGHRQFGIIFEGDEEIYTPDEVRIPTDRIFQEVEESIEEEIENEN